MGEPVYALSIRQPWAWLIVNGHKNIENRTWRRSFIGEVWVHAGKQMDDAAFEDLVAGRHPVTAEPADFGQKGAAFHRGGIVGRATITGCVSASRSPWFVGPYAFTIREARPVPFMPCRGALGFFKPEFAHA